MVDKAPLHELPGRFTIQFLPPSEETHHALDYGVRFGGFKDPLLLAHVELPPTYPFSEIDVVFKSDRYENSPYGYSEEPHWVSWYDVNIKAALRESRAFSEENARRILMVLQSNTGLGDYRQLKSGKHQIIVPGKGSLKPYDIYENFSEKNPHGVLIADMDLGTFDPQRGIEFWRQKKDQTPLVSDYKKFEERMSKLKRGEGVVIDSINIGLKSNYIYKWGEEDIMGFRGRWDREFDLSTVDSHPFDVPSRYLGVYSQHLNPFFKYAGPMLQAVCDTLGAKELPQIQIPVEMPSVAEQEIPEPFKKFLRELGFQ